jgi:hypothetical protein
MSHDGVSRQVDRDDARARARRRLQRVAARHGIQLAEDDDPRGRESRRRPTIHIPERSKP